MSRALGARAEDTAAAELERLGYRIVARNVSAKGGELDVVALDGPGTKATLCFVEVRARKSARFGGAEETVGALKQLRLRKAAAQFLARWRDPNVPCRFDVAVVDADGAVRIIRNAFE
jgi:putative endonuclease